MWNGGLSIRNENKGAGKTLVKWIFSLDILGHISVGCEQTSGYSQGKVGLRVFYQFQRLQQNLQTFAVFDSAGEQEVMYFFCFPIDRSRPQSGGISADFYFRSELKRLPGIYLGHVAAGGDNPAGTQAASAFQAPSPMVSGYSITSNCSAARLFVK